MTDPERFGAALRAVLEAEGVQSVRVLVPGEGMQSVDLDTAVAPGGFLPAFLMAADGLCRAATDGNLRFKLEPDPAAVLGYRAVDAGNAPAVALLYCMDIAREGNGKPEIAADDLMRVWREARAMQRPDAPPGPAPGP